MNEHDKKIGKEKVNLFLDKVPSAYQEGSLIFAYYVAFPGIFTANMLYQLWLNFNTYKKHNQFKQIHHIAIADLMQSNICRKIGFELFEMDKSVQQYLSKPPSEKLLNIEILFEKKELAAFSWMFADKYFTSPEKSSLRDILYWKSHLFIFPEQTAQEIANMLEEASVNNKLTKPKDIRLLLNVLDFQEKYISTSSLEKFKKYPMIDKHRLSNDAIEIRHPAILSKFKKVADGFKKKKNKHQEEVRIQIKKLKDTLESYIISSDFYNSIEEAFFKINNEPDLLNNLQAHRKRDREDFYPLQIFSLVNFSINSNIQEDIEELLKNIFLNINITYHSDKSIKQIEVPNIIYDTISKDLEEGLINESPEKRILLSSGILLLWVLGKYDLICNILGLLNGKYHHYSTAFLHAASIAKHIRTVEDLKKKEPEICKILKYIDTYEDKRVYYLYKFTQNYRTALGAAHIYFQLWDKSNASEIKFRIVHPEPRPEKSKSNTREYLDQAIFLLEGALKWLREDARYIENHHRKQYYYTILNNYIFYVTIACSDDKFHEISLIDGDIGELSRESNDQKLWQPIFDDTLALVNLRKALLLRREGRNFKQAIKEAERRVDKMINSTLGIEDYNSFIKIKNNIRELIDEEQQEEKIASIFYLTFKGEHPSITKKVEEFFSKTNIYKKLHFQERNNVSEYVISIELKKNQAKVYTLFKLGIFKQELGAIKVGWSDKSIVVKQEKRFEKDGGNLSNLNLSGIDFSEKDLNKINFKNTILKKANFSDASLIEADFTNANLSEANLTRSYLHHAKFQHTNLSNAILMSARLSRSELTFTDCTGANFADSNIMRALICDTIFFQANLTAADFSYSKIKNVNFSKATLTKSIFENTEIENCDFSNAIDID